MRRAWWILLAASCESAPATMNPPVTPSDDYRPCGADVRVGGFEVKLATGFTAVQGQVVNGVTPANVPMITAGEGPCQLLQPRVLACNPACTPGTTCGEAGQCIPTPNAIDLGELTVTGLAAEVKLSASAPVYFYTFRGSLPHPGFSPGAQIGLSGARLALSGRGIDALAMTSTSVRLARGTPVRVSWAAPSVTVPAKVHANLNIANHGGTPARIECELPDTGSLELPVSLTDRLLGFGFSGFPTLTLTRRTADRATLTEGCVDFVVQSQEILDVEIPGLSSCSDDLDCPPGQRCQPDLTCK